LSTAFIDTNVLLDHSEELFQVYDRLILCGVILEEIDKLKYSTSEARQYKARLASRIIEENENKIIYEPREGSFSLPVYLSKESNDNRIISILMDLYINDKSFDILSNDLNFRHKCKCLGLPVKKFGEQRQDVYKGYQYLSGNTEFINKLFQDIENGINNHGFLVNEYLILHNDDLNETYEYRFDGNKFIKLNLPPSKIIKGNNSVQRCALDLLMNKNIPIKIIVGGFGTGKTISATKVGLYLTIDKGSYNFLTYIRNPVPVDDTDIGFLPGSKSEKIYDYCRPFLQYLNNDKDQSYPESLLKTDKIKMDAVSFLKGVSIEDSFIIMDEAEDLSLKLLKTVGSRTGLKSCVVFTGDLQQSENKYKYNNGLSKLIQQKKGDPLVGIVMLDKVLRSPVAELFNDLV
jgi:PhoH-like ATPase